MFELKEIEIHYKSLMTFEERVNISTPKETFLFALKIWPSTIEVQESFYVLFLNRANQILGVYPLSKGNISATVVDVKTMIAVALRTLTQSIIMIHNHPSGNTKPSKADDEITKKVQEGCNYLDINLLDHLIITRESYYSYSEENKL